MAEVNDTKPPRPTKVCTICGTVYVKMPGNKR